MTIHEFKTEVDNYFGMVGFLEEGEEDKYVECYYLTYCAPSGQPIKSFRLLKRKGRMNTPTGWYCSGDRWLPLPRFDPENVECHRLAKEHIKKVDSEREQSDRNQN